MEGTREKYISLKNIYIALNIYVGKNLSVEVSERQNSFEKKLARAN